MGNDSKRWANGRSRRRLALGGAIVLALVGAGVGAVQVLPAAATGPKVTTLTLESPYAYTPVHQGGGTDDYHCTLVDPHVTQNSFIISNQFNPGPAATAKEVHHEISFLVPPDAVPTVRQLNRGGKGWTCFGESPVPTTSLASLGATPWLSAWAPGHGEDVLPAGTGTPLPAHSMVVMQTHYNLLQGDKPVRVGLRLNTVPASADLRPLSTDPYVAPINMPCAPAVAADLAAHPLCDRQASLNFLAKRFGTGAVVFQNILESICGQSISSPPEGNSATCTWRARGDGYITRVTAHMHLQGVAMTIVLDPGTPQAQTILNVPNYNFDYQKSYNLKKWVRITPGSTVQVNCTYNPQLAQELPALRRAPAHFVTWGDGSSDEMCLGLLNTVPANPHAMVNWSHPFGGGGGGGGKSKGI